MIRLGLTGSIGMGKTTTAAMFAEEGAPVFDADAAVHQLYASGGAGAVAIEAAFPGVTVNGAVDRQRLSARVVGDPDALARLEAIVHPLVAELRSQFLRDAEAHGALVVVLDIPLLFESGRRPDVDAVVVASAPEAEQRRRVLARPGATLDRFQALLARQMPDAEKRRRADFVVDTGQGLEAARGQVRLILSAVREPQWRPKARLEGADEASH